jgi:hypothetical protein
MIKGSECEVISKALVSFSIFYSLLTIKINPG